MSSDAPTLKRAPSKPLTVAAIAALKPGQVLADGGIPPGAGRLKIRKRATKAGAVTEWLFIYWGPTSGKRETMTLNGNASRFASKEQEGYLTIAQARDIARKFQAQLQSGVDPAEQRRIEKVAAQKAQLAEVTALKEAKDKTLLALMDAYAASLRSRNKARSAYDVENITKNHISTPYPELAAMPAADLTAKQVAQILGRMVGPDAKEKKGRTALKLRAYMAAAFRLALGSEIDPMAPAASAGFGLTTNPAAAVPPTKMAAHFQKVGDRTLSESELRSYLIRLSAVASPMHKLALELQIMAGGQRLQQLLRVRHTDLSPDTFTLYDPKGKRAQPRIHVLPLLPELRARIDQLRAINPVGNEKNPKGFLFASTGGSIINPETLSGVVRGISNAMVAAEESVKPFRGGDIRRTCETLMADVLRISKDVRAQLLSHGLGGVQDKVYDKGSHLHAKTIALKRWIQYLETVRKSMPKPSNVVQMKVA